MEFALLYVSDLDQALAYFTQTLGLQHVPEADTPVFRGFGPEVGKLTFGICVPFDETRRPGQVELYFNTDDFEGLHKTLATKGVQTTPITPVYFGSIFTVDAPDQHLVTMVRHPSA